MDGAAEDWTRTNPLQQQRADWVLGQVIAWVEDGQCPDRSELPDGDPDLLTYHGLFGRLRIDVHRGLVYEDGGQGQVCHQEEIPGALLCAGSGPSNCARDHQLHQLNPEAVHGL